MTLTKTELMTLFDRPADEARWINSADALEDNARVFYFLDRIRKESSH